ncbi:MAG: acyl-CoA synthetase [Spirochaetaceae bacterium]|nr:MAG: acyl-CoA synthetase [Spirochaetaceae bacterium]
MADTWRLIFNPEGDAADMVAYASALVEGRIAGKYMLSTEKLPDTLVVQGFRQKGILAGADVDINKDTAKKYDIKVANYPRSGRGGPKPVGTVNLAEVLKTSSRKFNAVETAPDDPAVLLYTSGTTGRPKGVTLTHRNFAQQCINVSKVLPLDESDTIVLVLPLFHVYGLSNGLISGVYFGTRMTLVPQYSPAKLLEAIEHSKATVLIAIPTMYMHLLQIARTRKASIPKSLRLCVSGGAPLSLTTLREFEEAFQTRIAEGYGLTETTSSVCLNKSGEAFKPGSIGPAAEGVEMRVFDDNDAEVPDGQEGEIVIRSDVVTPGYWNNPEETAEAIRDGWLHTGDLGYRDADGFFFITDRKKDLIIRGGFNISPREIEELLFTHPAIQDAAVIAVHDKRDREAVKACVVLHEGQSVTEREVLDFCSQNLADYKVPKYVEFRPSLPKSATGKILRKELREGYHDDRLLDKQSAGRKEQPHG